MLEYEVVAYPYAVQYGTINVPDTVEPEEVDDYIAEHWGDIKFEGNAEFDYAGTDFETAFIRRLDNEKISD